MPDPIEAECRVQTQFATVFVFLALSVAFVLITQVLSFLLRPHALHEAKQRAYECGEEPEGSPWVQFNLRFYLVALFFIIFDVEMIFLLPWAVAFNDMLAELGAFAFWEMVVFIGILVLGLAYVWAKGDLDWVKSLAQRDADDFSPLSRYSSGDLEEHWDVKPREIDHDAA
jgi:NADH-quinone oxidoreductase subunit A